MSLKQLLADDIKTAMRSGEKSRVKTLRMVTAAIKQREIDERTDLDDGQILAVLEKMIKQRRDSEDQYRQGGREDLATVEAAEIEILSRYMPEPLSEAELDNLIDEAIATTGAESMQQMGQVMGHLKPQVQGRADMKEVSARVRTRLAG